MTLLAIVSLSAVCFVFGVVVGIVLALTEVGIVLALTALQHLFDIADRMSES